MEAGQRRLADDTASAATNSEVQEALEREATLVVGGGGWPTPSSIRETRQTGTAISRIASRKPMVPERIGSSA